MSIDSQSISGNSSLKNQRSQFYVKIQQKLKNIITEQSVKMQTENQLLKSLLKKNQDNLVKQNIQTNELSDRIKAIQARTQSKLISLSKQLQSFKNYYQQCSVYTLKRINEVSDRASIFTRQIQRQIQQINTRSPVQFVKYAFQLVVSITQKCLLKTTQIQNLTQDELFYLQIQIGKLNEQCQKIQQLSNQLKIVQYGNESFQQALETSTKILIDSSQSQMKSSQIGKKIINFYQPKFKEIIKRMNGYSIQIQLIKKMFNNESAQISAQQQNKQIKYNKDLNDLQSRLHQMQTEHQQQKKYLQKQTQKKQEVLKKRHDRILELQQSTRVQLDKQIKMQHQISELKLQNFELLKQLKALSKLNQQQLQHKNNQKIGYEQLKNQAEMKFEQKYNFLQKKYDKILVKLQIVQQQLNSYKQKNTNIQHQNLLSKSQKLIRGEFGSPKINKNNIKNNKYSVQKVKDLKFSVQKSLIKTNITQSFHEIQLQKQNQKLSRQNKQLRRVKLQIQNQVNRILADKAKQNKEEQVYLDQIEAQLQRNVRQIEILQNKNLLLVNKIHELEQENERLQEQLTIQTQNFRIQTKNFKILIHQLQNENQNLKARNQQLQIQLQQQNDQLNNLDFKNSPSYLQTQSTNYVDSNIKNMKVNKYRETTQRRPRKSSNFLMLLQDAILQLGLPVPICCQLDKNGFVRQRKTGNYLVDYNKNPMRISENQLKAAMESGLLLI